MTENVIENPNMRIETTHSTNIDISDNEDNDSRNRLNLETN